jgi:hypothetical protein
MLTFSFRPPPKLYYKYSQHPNPTPIPAHGGEKEIHLRTLTKQLPAPVETKKEDKAAEVQGGDKKDNKQKKERKALV